MPIDDKLAAAACIPVPLRAEDFNPRAKLPYGVTAEHVHLAMADYLEFLGFVNGQLATRKMPRLESFLMSANFSSMVGEFMTATLPTYSPGVKKNRYHNGHPDLVPSGRFPGDAAQHEAEGIEVKASRYMNGWQGHNAEDVWLMVFCFDSNTARDEAMEVAPRPFKFVKVVGAQLNKEDWNFSGRSETSRRTITASVTRSGCAKMEANWIYRAPSSSLPGL